MAVPLLETSAAPERLIADKAYDADALIEILDERGTERVNDNETAGVVN